MNENDRKEIEKMINQSVLSKEEIRTEIIKPLLLVSNADQEADRKVINQKLDMIIEQTTKHNQRMTKIEDKAVISDDKIVDLEKTDLQHANNCPYTDNIRVLEDNQLSQKSIKKWIVVTVGIASGVIVAAVKLIQLLGDKI